MCFVSECFIHSRFAIVWKANKCYYFYVSSIQNFTISTKHIKTASYTITYFIHGNLQGVLFNWIRTELEMVLNLEPFAARPESLMYFIVNLKNGWANFRHFVGAHEGSAIVMSIVGNVFGRYYDSDFRHKNARREVVSSSSLFL